MYLSNLKVNNYRNFSEFDINFKKGLNVIVGPNNSGKSGLLKAIGILSSLNNLVFDDFNKNDLKINWNNKYKNDAPIITMEFNLFHDVYLNNFEDETLNDLIPFLNTQQIQEKINSQRKKYYEINVSIKLEYILDSKKKEEYIDEICKIKSFEEYLNVFKKYSNYYQWIITNGINENIIEKKKLNNIVSIDFIDAERNSEAIYKKIDAEFKNFFSKDENKDIQLNVNNAISKLLKDAIKGKIDEIDKIIVNEKNDIGLKKGYVSISQNVRTDVGLNSGYIIDVNDTKEKFDLPLTHNGVGYNNLINIYLLIKLIELDKNNFRILCLEEPEAHLHPAMQYKLFKYIKKLDEEENLNQQIFVTTHSSNITSIAGLDNIIMINYQRDEQIQKCVSQIVFDIFKEKISDAPEEIEMKNKSKSHLTKFLDVTRCDLLFAEKIILVEGISEKMLIPILINKFGTSYEEEHISIVEIGGNYFDYFLFLFKNNIIKKKVLCITDKDYKYFDSGTFDMLGYNNFVATHISKIEAYKCQTINYKTQQIGGITLEDELFLSSSDELQLLLLKKAFIGNECLTAFINDYGINYNAWSENVNLISHPKTKEKITKEINQFNDSILKSPTKSAEIQKLFFANVYYKYIKNNKGNNILEIISDENICNNLTIPKYIEEGIEWLLK